MTDVPVQGAGGYDWGRAEVRLDSATRFGIGSDTCQRRMPRGTGAGSASRRDDVGCLPCSDRSTFSAAVVQSRAGAVAWASLTEARPAGPYGQREDTRETTRGSEEARAQGQFVASAEFSPSW